MLSRLRLSRRAVWALVFILAAGAIYWLVGRENREVHLPDGRIMRVVGVTYGTNHLFEDGPFLGKLAAHVGAPKWARRFGYTSWAVALTNPCASLMVWMRCVDPISTSPNRVYASVSDRRGTETDSALYEILSASLKGGSKDERLMAWRFDNFPRRQRTLRIRLYEYDLFQIRRTRLAEISVPNPVRHLSAPFRASLAPMTATNGELECSLVSLRCGDAPPRAPLTAKHALAPWNTAEFGLRENGQPTTAWTVRGIEAFGATGNYLSAPGHAQNGRLIGELAGDRRVVHFASAFWPDEPDWKLVVEVARARDFEPGSNWTVQVPVGSFSVGSFFTDLQAEAVGVRQGNLRVTVTTATSTVPRSADHGTISLLLDYTPTSSDLHMDLARAVDDRGRELRIFNANSPWYGRLQADLEMATNANIVELQFAIHRSRKFEFKVKPVFVSTNVPSTFPASTK
jgi:hypothetical protein